MAAVHQYASCPVCGHTVKLALLNFDEQGNRVAEPMQYGTYVKTKHINGPSSIRWITQPMPEHMLRGLLAQLEVALEYVRAQLI